MREYLVIFDPSGQLETVVEYVGDGDPTARLFQAEAQLQAEGGGRGVVLLIAESEESIRQTHSHYFRSTDELLELAAG